MNVLVIDTSGNRIIMAVQRDGRIIRAIDKEAGTRQAEMLPSSQKELVESSGLSPRDFNGIAVTTGPGSFTGLRVGISHAKGMALALDLPLLPLNTLDSMAWSISQPNGYISPLIDAKKEQVYTALYLVKNGTFNRMSGYTATGPEEWLSGLPSGTLIFGSGAARYSRLMPKHKGLFLDDPVAGCPTVNGLASLTHHLALKDAWVPCDRVNAFYIRPSDAEAQKSG
jgi:tRNA threonylcarbamoyladenosine biosynthesis protein TsaB